MEVISVFDLNVPTHLSIFLWSLLSLLSIYILSVSNERNIIEFDLLFYLIWKLDVFVSYNGKIMVHV